MPGRPQRARELKAVHVRQVQIQQQEIHGRTVQDPACLRARVRLADRDEARHPAHVEHVCVGGHGIVLDHEDPDGLRVGHVSPPGAGEGPTAARNGNRTSNTAPPSSASVTVSVPSSRPTV